MFNTILGRTEEKGIKKPKPTSIKDVETEAVKLGLLKKPEEALKTPRGKLIAACYQSWKINRSFNHVTTILLGETGVGKSSTINHMLGLNLAKTDRETSDTRETTEYRITEPDENFAVSDLSLGIIDTPGFGDTAGFPQDACNLMSIKQFWHHQKCKPNVILIVFDATNKRYKGEQSNFFKSLRAFSRLDLVDTKKPNVIVVMTNACSLPKKTWKSELQLKAISIKRLIKQTLHVEPPVVFIENQFDEHELKMTETGNQSTLPDGTLQPSNLFLAIANLLKENEDNLALETFKHFFKTSEESKVVNDHISVQAKIAIKDQLSAEETKLYRILMDEESVGSQLPEIITKANNFISTKGSTLTEDNKRDINYIAEILVEKLGILSLRDLKGHSIESISSLISNEPLNSFEESVLRDVYKLEPKPKAPVVFLSVGAGYNILSDEIKPAFVFEQNNLIQSSYGINLPKGMTMTTVSDTQTYMNFFEKEEEYVKQRLSQLSINADADSKMFQMKSRGGFCKSIKSHGDQSAVAISCLYEKRIFRVGLCDLKELKVSENFRNDVFKDLPLTYEKNDPKNRASYQNFFDYWGHFVVSTAYGGGTLEIDNTFRISNDHDKELLEAKTELQMGFKNISSGFQFNNDSSKNHSASKMLSTSHLKWNGGDSQYHVAAITQVTPEKWKLWESSLVIKPAFLSTEMSLIPISKIVELVDDKRTSGCKQALDDLLGGKFKTYKKEEEENEKIKEESKKKPNEMTDRKEVADSVQSKSGGDCFPGLSTVVVKGFDQPKLTQDLGIGDEVLAYDAAKKEFVYSTVFMFGHRNPDRDMCYLQIKTLNSNIYISDKHIIFKQNDGGVTEAVFAEEIKPGDKIFQTDRSGDRMKLTASLVVSVQKRTCHGLYAPFTLAGTIIVDGTLASCYANVKKTSLLGLLQLCPHSIAHRMLAPLRGIHTLGLSSGLLIPKDKDQPTIIETMKDKFRYFLVF